MVTGSCGSNALNHAVEQYLRELLKDHAYLNRDGATIEGYARKLSFHDFEHRVKPNWEVGPGTRPCVFEIPALEYDPGIPKDSRENAPGRLTIPFRKLNEIFRTVCSDVADVMMKQLTLTTQKVLKIKQVVLMGGFGYGSSVQLYLPHEYIRTTLMDAVAAGGVLRALNKSNGPKRVAKSSYGVRCDEPYDPVNCPSHQGQRTIQGIHNTRETYVQTIQWVVKLEYLIFRQVEDEEIGPDYEAAETRYQTFAYWNDDGSRNTGPFICRDEIWVSDTANLDHQNHDNQDAERIGIIETDITGLYEHLTASSSLGTEYLEFTYELKFIVDGLNMKCLHVCKGDIIGELKVSMAPGFLPGAT
ncbi:hypothetical protein F53441_7136 [Fusarium austroafricanum]|uniref:Uncharacterized protein n=1 Tax=Fusarium austroafricanum TaxID=2364996 RepID=A0A8H4KG72_9HYPO|nr:hypothetical protein F53441_7136 [Fusarium austroafricanum]